MIGTTIGHYRVLEKLGEGGMARVFRAEDSRLRRSVALKLLPDEVASEPGHVARFRQEAEAVAALNHPNIVTIHSIEEVGGLHFLTLELVEGETLDRVIPGEGLVIERFFELAQPITDAVAAAHDRGIVHRDLKPGNVMVDREGRVKVLDFGLAKFFAHQEPGDDSRTMFLATQMGMIVGTPAYMAPEQVAGRGVDRRTDVFALGLLFYEMLTGRRAFAADSLPEQLAAVLHASPKPLAKVRPDLPRRLARLVSRCLEKDPGARYGSAAEVRQALRGAREQIGAGRWRPAALRRPAVAAALAGALVALVAGGGWLWRLSDQRRWARQEAPVEVERLLGDQRFFEAFDLARAALARLPGDPQLTRLLESASVPVAIRSDPPGARFLYKPYLRPEEPWQEVGATPLEGIRLPTDQVRWRMEKEGFAPAEGSFPTLLHELSTPLLPAERALPGMVWVPPGAVEVAGETVALDGFWIDRYEVTNREFARFVAAGGYEDRDLWQPVLDAGGATWEEARRLLRDRTGRSAPAGWELGSPPEGTEDLPVSGISWYEAAAYCRSAGKDLPTVYHWRRAAGYELYAYVGSMSNFSAQGPAPPGTYAGVSRHGAYDMAGNVKEWCWNAAGDHRYILGGAWDEPAYLYLNDDASPPRERSGTFGVRCARFEKSVPEALRAPLATSYHDFSDHPVVDDEVFAAFRRFYAYEAGRPLEARLERVEETPRWRRETVSYDAAYGGERIVTHLFVPDDVAPPYQAVTFFPGSNALRPGGRSDHPKDFAFIDFLVRSGRVLVYPVYKHTYERAVPGWAWSEAAARERQVQWSQDVGRTLDYLETRPDIDAETIGFLGLSLGANVGPILAAIDERLRPVVLVSGGLSPYHHRLPPELVPLNYAPRVRAPVLMIGGRSDFLFGPEEMGRRPLFDRFGAPTEHKRFVLLDGGHVPDDWNGVVRETLDWLDRYQGPVRRVAPGSE